MRKLTFLAGAATGFVIGSRMGRGPYQQLESKVRSVVSRPEVQKAAQQAQDTAKEQVKSAASRLPHSSGANVDAPQPSVPSEHYADPQDLEFGKAAAEKEAQLDNMLANGQAPEAIANAEQHLEDQGQLSVPSSAHQETLADETGKRSSKGRSR